MKTTYEELEIRNQELEIRIFKLEQHLKVALDTIRKLEERLNKNSKNSSKPPSSDQKTNTTQDEKQPRPPRPGMSRLLCPLERVNDHVTCTREHCSHCLSSNLQILHNQNFIWQQAELPAASAIITQFTCLKYRCNECEKQSTADLPYGVSHSAFGPRLMACMAALTGQFHLAKREAIELIKNLYDVDLSLGSITNIEETISLALAPVYEKINQFVIGSGIVRNCDETGWRDSGKTHFAWVVTNVRAAFFKLDRHRSQEVFLNIIKNQVHIPTITDRYGVYNVLTGPHQYCLAHLIRDFRKFAERQGEDGKIGKEIEKLLAGVCKLYRERQKDELPERKYRCRLTKRKKKLEDLLLDGFNEGSEEFAGLCERILDRFEHLWIFAQIAGVEPTNNRAERDLRKLVLWRKKSYGTRSQKGMRFVETITSVAESLKKNGMNILNFLEDALRRYYCGKEAPLINPAFGF